MDVGEENEMGKEFRPKSPRFDWINSFLFNGDIMVRGRILVLLVSPKQHEESDGYTIDKDQRNYTNHHNHTYTHETSTLTRYIHL
jgi:hypothetical protein